MFKAKKPYTITLLDNFDGPSIGTQKSIVLTEIGFFGGRNLMLAYFFFGAAGVIALVICFYFIFYFRLQGDMMAETEDFLDNLTY